MLVFNRRLVSDARADGGPGVAAPHEAITPIGELRLTYDWRQKTRSRVTITRGQAAGQEIGLDLERGTVLRDGELIATDAGQVVLVRSAVEQLLHVTASSSLELARIAYHLGNRHVPLQIGQDAQGDWVRLQLDHVLENMARGLGATITVVSAPFDPETGAYGHGGHGHDRGHEQAHEAAHEASQPRAGSLFENNRHEPRIHDFLEPDS